MPDIPVAVTLDVELPVGQLVTATAVDCEGIDLIAETP